MWKIAWGALPTSSALNQRVSSINPSCMWCTLHHESLHHLFWECELARWAWSFVQKWWNISDLNFSRINRSIFHLLRLFKQKHINRIWETVVAATLWTIWLARNDYVFNHVRIKQHVMQKLIKLRISKWGLASKLIPFSHFPLWNVNPVGAIIIHHHWDVSRFWEVRMGTYHAVCMVAAMWCSNIARGGIGGVIKNKSGSTIYRFSGPSEAQSYLEAEIFGVLHVLHIIRTTHLRMHSVVVCSGSIKAIDSIYEGLDRTFPLLARNFT